VERVVAAGARSSSGKAAGPIARVLRDLMLPLILKRVASGSEKSFAWLYDYHISWDEKLADTAGRGRPKSAGELMR
jgi:hypothetical protein